MNFSQNLRVILICFHCVLLFLINLLGTYSSVLDVFYNYDELKKNKLKDVPFVLDITYNPVVWAYSTYSGVNSVYNFYAPNVGSEFLLYFELLDKNNKVISVKRLPELAQKESRLRFSLCTTIMQEKLKRFKDKRLNDFIKAVFKQVSLFALKGEPGATRIRTFVYVNDYPTLTKFNSGESYKSILIKRYEFSIH